MPTPLRKLFLIGNGFDLSHGLKSRYSDFIDDILSEFFGKNNTYDELISYAMVGSERGNHTIARILAIDEDLNIIKNHFLKSLFRNSQTNNIEWSDFEKLYFLRLTKSCHKKEAVVRLNDDFTIFRKNFIQYLKNIISEHKFEPIYEEFFNKFFNPATDLVLNFNYTSIADNYLHNKKANCVHIHGDLNSDKDNIILGYAPNEVDMQFLRNKTPDMKLTNRFIKKFLYLDQEAKPKLDIFLALNKPFDVFVMGHSLGASDEKILKDIFLNPNLSKISFFYHENEERLKDMQYHFDDFIRNEEVFHKLHVKSLCFFSPQNEDKESQRKFSEGIKSYTEYQNALNTKFFVLGSSDV